MIDVNETWETGPADGWIRIDTQFRRTLDWQEIESRLVDLMGQWFNKVGKRHYEVIIPPTFRYVHSSKETYVRVFCEGRIK